MPDRARSKLQKEIMNNFFVIMISVLGGEASKLYYCWRIEHDKDLTL